MSRTTASPRVAAPAQARRVRATPAPSQVQRRKALSPPASPAPKPDDGIEIDREFSSLIPPQSKGERAQMRRSLIAEGCRDDLIRWKGHQSLVEGFHRFDLCRELGTSYRIKDKEFADREAVKAWIVQNQTGRRNLSAEAMSYFRGLRYQAEKMAHGGARPKSHSTYHGDRLDTAQRLAQDYGVGPATIYRDGKFAKAVDAITRNCGLEIKPQMLARHTGLKRGAVRRLAKMNPGKQRDAIRRWLETGKLPKRGTDLGIRADFDREGKARRRGSLS